jgi:hypothetical protein
MRRAPVRVVTTALIAAAVIAVLVGASVTTAPVRANDHLPSCLSLTNCSLTGPQTSTPTGRFTVDFINVTCPTSTSTTWCYSVTTTGPGTALSHFLIGVCDEITNSNLVSATVNGVSVNASIGLDPTTGKYGVKFDVGQDNNTTATYCFTLNLSATTTPALLVRRVDFAVKIGGGPNVFESGRTCGPSTELCAPAAAGLESFAATRSEDGKVSLRWQSGYEVDTLGYNVYRDQGGKLTKVTQELVAGSALLAGPGTALTAGATYSWSDIASDDVQYWLEEVDTGGRSTWSGPYSVKAEEPTGDRGWSRSDEPVMMSRMNAQASRSNQAVTRPVERTAKLAEVGGKGALIQAAIAIQNSFEISVKQEGWYRITQPELAAAGLSPDVNPRNLQLFADGQELAINVPGEKDGRFDSTDSIEFYGIGLDTPSTDTRSYFLKAGSQPGRRIKQATSKSTSGPGGGFPFTVQREDKLYYFGSVLNGDAENFFGALVQPQAVDQALRLTNVAQGIDGECSIEVVLQGLTNVSHRVSVSLNGSELGSVDFNGQDRPVTTFTVRQSDLIEGDNIVRLGSLAGSNDYSFVDYIRLTFLHSFKADDNALMFTSSSGQVTVGGFTSSAIRVVDVTDSSSPQEIAGVVKQDGSGYSITATVSGKGQRTLLAFADSQVKRAAGIAANLPSSWRSSANKGDLVIIAPRDFFGSLAALRSLRESEGLSVALVDIEDVYDEFSYGQKSPQAIRDFLAYAKANWKIAPRFVLFAGDASFDPRNYLGLGNSDLVPTKLVDTATVQTSSDDWFADVNGDGFVDLATGRLPARSAQALSIMVDKIVSYDLSEKPEGVLFVADANGPLNFENANDDLKTLIPGSIPVDEILRGQLGTSVAKAQLLDALNSGRRIVNYLGHGGIPIWRDNLLTTDDAVALQNRERLPIVIAMTCLNGYFIDDRTESLGEALLGAEGGGAVAVWASTGLTGSTWQVVANQELLRQMFSGAPITLGEATMRAKSAQVGDADVRRTWTLLGDPSQRFYTDK